MALRVRALLAVLGLLIAGCSSGIPASQTPTAPGVLAHWQQWAHLKGVFDLQVMSDGSLLAAASGGLFHVSGDGTPSPIAPDYRPPNGPEAYIALGPGCGSAPTADLRLIDPGKKPAVLLVPLAGGTAGPATRFRELDGNAIGGLNGIAVAGVGPFRGRVLVTGTHDKRAVVMSVGCAPGDVKVVTSDAPALEGGLVVAEGARSYAGQLIATDEVSGRLYAIAPRGEVTTIANSTAPVGGDIGIESVAQFPANVAAGRFAYFSDRATANNAHPGTDSILRISLDDLVRAGVRPGDLLTATEGGAVVEAVRCDAIPCTMFKVADGPPTAHGEGHIVFSPR